MKTDQAADDESLSADCTAILTVVNSRNGRWHIVAATAAALLAAAPAGRNDGDDKAEQPIEIAAATVINKGDGRPRMWSKRYESQ